MPALPLGLPQRPARWGGYVHPGWHVPLSPMRVRGVLALRPEQARWLSIPER
ncbi:hypothetical protein [Rhodoferax sp.]|uniref:hypothetical protein n=1 Tax=Rhodoferax sp. TaxID=50421 RepID=UPI002ACDA5F7|nr:hypothetical protein [Rhodoferax sp.]MDZ7918639.1 hypothetical protein [Rhodoferax sp.]